jgi:hypothetical protein
LKKRRLDEPFTEDEDIKLTDAVQRYGGKDWNAISALVSGQTRNQCYKRWHNTLTPSIGLKARRTGKGQQSKTASLRMQYKRTVARIGSQFPRWFQVKRKNSVGADGRMPLIPVAP